MNEHTGACIALLITTYHRNERMLRLAHSLVALVKAHRGPNRYIVCVADSNPRNEAALPPGVCYLVNPGQGFDDNLLGAFRFLAGIADHVVALADDDMLCPFIDPLAVIDAALQCGEHDVVLFNHVPFTGTGQITLGERYYGAPEAVTLSVDPVPMLAGRMPRYAGVMYRLAYIEQILPRLARFSGSLHAYAAPIYMAAEKRRLLFFDHALVLFHDEPKTDGAWESALRVHHGLLQFLRQMAGCLAAPAHATLVEGMHRVFFRINRKEVWRTELPDVPDYPTLDAFRSHLATLQS